MTNKIGRERRRARTAKNSVLVEVSQLFFSKPVVNRIRMGESIGEGLWRSGEILKHIVREYLNCSQKILLLAMFAFFLFSHSVFFTSGNFDDFVSSKTR